MAADDETVNLGDMLFPPSMADFKALVKRVDELERRLEFFNGHTHQNSYNPNNTTRPFTGPPAPNMTNKARG